MKKNWTVDQKVKLVVGFTNSGMTKKAYCAKHGLNADVFRRWQTQYKNGTLTASKKLVAKTSAPTNKSAKPKAKKTAKSVVKKAKVKPSKKPFSFWTRRADKKTILSLMADNERYSIQLKDSRNEVFDLKNQIKDLKLQKEDWKNQAERLAWNA